MIRWHNMHTCIGISGNASVSSRTTDGGCVGVMTISDSSPPEDTKYDAAECQFINVNSISVPSYNKLPISGKMPCNSLILFIGHFPLKLPLTLIKPNKDQAAGCPISSSDRYTTQG